jgi:4-alpha-glucanotransferase
VLVPLFSLRSERGWGIGEIPDLKDFSDWLADAGHGLLQLLPVNEVAPGENSPYASMSAFALDPMYLSLPEIEDFQAIGGEQALDAGRRARLEAVREAPRVDYDAVRELKRYALRLAFERFREHEYARGSRRAGAFDSFVEEHAGWLRDYALFRALHHRYESHWESWPAELRQRQPQALEEQRRALAHEILFRQYLQWQAHLQWQEARRAAAEFGVRLKGDLPFMVSGHSADVWAFQHQFRMDAWVGAPPDAFSVNGQNWGLPAYNWEAMAADDCAWLRGRARRAAELFDAYRVDHLVGFYRTYTIPRDRSQPYFSPGREEEQHALGERLMGVFKSAGAVVMAEDLGTVPDFVRHSLTRQDIAGYKVLRWEREWHTPGQPFRDPASYPEVSVACSGTHDTETLAVWWEHIDGHERREVCRIPAMRSINPEERFFTPTVHQALLEALYGAGSRYLVLPIQDVLGTRERINLPASVGPENWTYRLPMNTSEMGSHPQWRQAFHRIAGCALRHGRFSAARAA